MSRPPSLSATKGRFFRFVFFLLDVENSSPDINNGVRLELIDDDVMVGVIGVEESVFGTRITVFSEAKGWCCCEGWA